MPDADSTKALLVGPQTANAGAILQDTRTFAESFSLLARYGEEFMDENPLVGEPGSFILSKSGDTDRGAASKQPSNVNRPGSIPGKVGTPQVKVDTPGKTPEKGATPSASDDSKIRKKKAKIGN
ncbi:unnamed protein product [Aspergillus oryzae]|nr:unnamed protein product [Aspergillus oryzae]GMF91184.1 unnamed protein product [Aspergillus oryzae]GMG11713.1 unnamed protein product [Aspergillus oryzae]GMG33190.1 unnamed protein product [Aspergillus oryzae]GMG49247.1 unnamed protein product [Aspergillus oryzae var. brunneus]